MIKVEGEAGKDGEADKVMVGVTERIENDEDSTKNTNDDCSPGQLSVMPRTVKKKAGNR